MHIAGSRTVGAPREAVYAAILDPHTLLAVVPGCREVEQTDDGAYRGVIALRLPGVTGTYRTVVRVANAEAPSDGRLEGEVAGVLGTISGHATFHLVETGRATRVEYDGRATIDGPLARLDSRFLEGLAASLVDQGLGNLDARLQAEASGTGAADGDSAPADSDSTPAGART